MIKVGVDVDEEDYEVINGVTILTDRYSGIWSGGKFTAWDMPLSEIPYAVVDNDCPCRDFWYSLKAKKYLIGLGDTAQEAYEDLMGKKEKQRTVIDLLKPTSIWEVERKITELRSSDKFMDIEIKGRAPIGEYCDYCQHLTTKYEPRICSWNDEVTGMVDYAYCQFFNSPLTAEKENSCNSRYRKCLGCLLQTKINEIKDKTDE